MSWMEQRVNSWNDLVGAFEAYGAPGAGVDFIFRGQSNAEWSLQPSLLRLGKDLKLSDQHLRALEKAALKEFKRRAHFYQPYLASQCHEPTGWWPMMQHFGAPTRLLDWTCSPFVALYFAIGGNQKVDGAIWLFSLDELQLQHAQKFGTSAKLPGKRDLQSEVEAEAEAFYFSEKAIDSLYGVEANLMFDRMNAQQGIFTVSQNLTNNPALIVESLLAKQPNLFVKLLIPANLKPIFLKRLHLMNINAHSLFPGLEGLGMSIAELIKIDAVRMNSLHDRE